MTIDKRHTYLYSYCIESSFAPAVAHHFFKLRATPQENAFQHITKQHMLADPVCQMLTAVDGFGNDIVYGGYEQSHATFRIECNGIVECMPYAIPEMMPADIYLFPTPLTGWDDSIKEMAAGKDATDIMHAVHEHLSYERFITDNTTTAIEAYRLRQGVCQDYAHLMIAACRSQGMHARYVNGLTMGEGETHAWVEVWQPADNCTAEGHWIGYDPTHDTITRRGYLKFAHGRDVNDCPTNRGRFYGWTSEIMTVKANLNDITAPDQLLREG